MFSVIQTRKGFFFIIGIQDFGFSASLLKLVNNQDHKKTSSPSIEIVLMKISCVTCLNVIAFQDIKGCSL